MAPSRINNPFKEREHNWFHYGLLLVIALGLTIMFVTSDASNPGSSPGSAKTFHPKIVNHHKKKPVDDDEEEAEEESFPALNEAEYLPWLHTYYTRLEWPNVDEEPLQLTSEVLQESLKMGCANIANNQRPEGNFNYEYDFIAQKMNSEDSQVRQAGALWGVTLCFQHYPSSSKLKKAVEKGIDFFLDHSIDGPNKSVIVQYPGMEDSQTGTNALFGLSLIDYIRTVQDNGIKMEDERLQQLKEKLTGVIEFIKSLQRNNLHFSQTYYLEEGRNAKSSSPYFDGEAMLCLVKAARYLDGFETLVPIIEDAAPILAKAYTVDVWQDEHDSDQTKGFYQWSSMLFKEYYDAGWKDSEIYGDYVIILAHWIINTHNILTRVKNTGYAFEGIVSAYDIAKARDSEFAEQALTAAIDQGLHKLTTWQVNGPLSHLNKFLKNNPTDDKKATGGIMNARNEAPLRIDTTQHQMHALMMALSSVYTN